MNYQDALNILEQLAKVVTDYEEQRYTSSEQAKEMAVQIYQLYGSVENIYEQFAGRNKVEVQDGRHVKVFKNYFEAGFMSSRTFHQHEGYTELMKVIGRVRQAAQDRTVARDERSVATVVEILQRFRKCCQYLKDAPHNERAVQDIIWIMLRSRFDRLDREDSLPRFGLKRYIPDFGIPELRLLIEVKFVGDATNPGSMQEEILADVSGYLQEQSRYDAIVVFIYDDAHKIRDDRKLIEDLTKVPGIIDVLVMPGIH